MYLQVLISIIFLLASIFCGRGLLADDSSFSDGEELGIAIMGTITNTKMVGNVALVKELKTGRVKAVKNGFLVLKEYRVAEVTPKYIILVKSKRKYLVYQNKFAGDFKNVGGKVQRKPSSHISGEYSEEGFERKNSKVTMTSDYLGKLLTEDFAKILMQATAIPKMEDGKVIGFSILQIDKGSIFDKAGFTNDDVVTSINGNALNSVSGAVKVLRSVRGESFVEVEILRNGSPQKIEISVAH